MQSFVKSALLVLALGFGSLAVAQDTQTTPTAPQTAAGHKANPAQELKHMSKQLGLSADQQSQIGPILADRQQRISALAGNTSLDEKTMRKQRRAIMLDTEQKIDTVLTPAQQQQLATLKAEHRHSKGAPAAAPPTAS